MLDESNPWVKAYMEEYDVNLEEAVEAITDDLEYLKCSMCGGLMNYECHSAVVGDYYTCPECRATQAFADSLGSTHLEGRYDGCDDFMEFMEDLIEQEEL